MTKHRETMSTAGPYCAENVIAPKGNSFPGSPNEDSGCFSADKENRPAKYAAKASCVHARCIWLFWTPKWHCATSCVARSFIS